MRWLERHRRGESIVAIVSEAAAALAERETALTAWLATEASHPLGS